jgi:rhomboid protease GluP
MNLDAAGAPTAVRRPPVVTATVLFITALVTGLQYVDPKILPALDRCPAAYLEGEWQRWLTALLVHDEGWRQIVCNFIALALVGAWVERRFGQWRWMALYLAGGIAGQLAGAAWQPRGAGASVAIAGLLGALFVWLLARGQRLPWRVRIWGVVGLLVAIVLTGFHDLHGPPILTSALLAALMLPNDRRLAD